MAISMYLFEVKIPFSAFDHILWFCFSFHIEKYIGGGGKPHLGSIMTKQSHI